MLYDTILVTGCGGDVGLGIGKVLKQTGLARVILGSDIHDYHPGSFIFDKCFVFESVRSNNYLDNLKKFIKDNRIDLIIPASEAELRFFSEKNIREIDGVLLLMPNAKAMAIGFDKLATANFLQEHDLPYPLTQKVSDGPPPFFPCIIKSRSGRGSYDVSMVDKLLIDYYIQTRPADIWQEYLLPDDQEYTCGLYRTRDGVYGEIVRDPEIEKLLVAVAEKLDLRGSINVQLRKTVRGPVIFEINPRFSGTVFFRHLIGFSDVVWALQESILTPYSCVQKNIKFYRGNNEFLAEQ